SRWNPDPARNRRLHQGEWDHDGDKLRRPGHPESQRPNLDIPISSVERIGRRQRATSRKIAAVWLTLFAFPIKLERLNRGCRDSRTCCDSFLFLPAGRSSNW